MTVVTATRTVVVLGASYAGHRAVQMLLGTLPPNWRIVTIERNSHFNHLYAFPRFGVLPGHEHKAFIPYTNIFRRLPADPPLPSLYGVSEYPPAHELIHGFVKRIEPNRVFFDRLSSSNSSAPIEGSVSFDYLVYALGSHLPSPINVWSSPRPSHGQPVADTPTLSRSGTKPEGVHWLRAAQDRIRDAKSVLIIGAGPLGVQTATDISEVHPGKRVTLVHSGPQLLPRFGKWMHDQALKSMTDLGVEVVLSSRVDLNSAEDHPDGTRTLKTLDGRIVGADLVVLCTGQKPNNEPIKDFFPAAIHPKTGLIHVLRTMQLGPGSNSPEAETTSPYPHIFVVGDAADAFGAMKAGHTATRQTDVAVQNISRLVARSEGLPTQMLGDEMDEYRSHILGIKMTIGLTKMITQRGDFFGTKPCPIDENCPNLWARRGLPVDDMTI